MIPKKLVENLSIDERSSGEMDVNLGMPWARTRTMMWAAFPATRELATHTILNLPTMQFPNLHLYGNPIFVGMDWGNFLGMTGMPMSSAGKDGGSEAASINTIEHEFQKLGKSEQHTRL